MLLKSKQGLDRTVETIVESQASEVEESPNDGKVEATIRYEGEHLGTHTDQGLELITNEGSL